MKKRKLYQLMREVGAVLTERESASSAATWEFYCGALIKPPDRRSWGRCRWDHARWIELYATQNPEDHMGDRYYDNNVSDAWGLMFSDDQVGMRRVAALLGERAPILGVEITQMADVMSGAVYIDGIIWPALESGDYELTKAALLALKQL